MGLYRNVEYLYKLSCLDDLSIVVFLLTLEYINLLIAPSALTTRNIAHRVHLTSFWDAKLGSRAWCCFREPTKLQRIYGHKSPETLQLNPRLDNKYVQQIEPQARKQLKPPLLMTCRQNRWQSYPDASKELRAERAA